MAHLPVLEFENFSIEELEKKIVNNEIFINSEYQRSFVWTPEQQRDLIDSILDGASIGVLVIWENKRGKLEILDGQQRVSTIKRFLNNEFENNKSKKFSDLSITEQSEIKAYTVFYLKLKSELSQESISNIFIRLQEGTPLNTAEKVNAFTGEFHKGFTEGFIENNDFFSKISNKRFRARLLSAQFLILELESNSNKRIFPSLTYKSLKTINDKYKLEIPEEVLKNYNRNIRFLNLYLGDEIKSMHPRDLISFYVLVSFLLDNDFTEQIIGNQIRKFVIELKKNINAFSIYDTSPPKGMEEDTFQTLLNYKNLVQERQKR